MTDPRCPPASAPDGLSTEHSVAPEAHAEPARVPVVPEASVPEPPLYDPYLTGPATPPRAGLSPLAVSSIVALLFGPVGSILAIVFGHQARREIERAQSRRSGYALATSAMVLGVVLTMGWGGALSYVAWTYGLRVDPAGDEPGLPAPESPAPPAPPAPHAPPLDVGPFAPRHTKMKQEGAINIVDVGISASSLAEELAKQRAEASHTGETMLVMTTAARCDPCRGVDRSLTDPLLQAALAKVRLVRVDVNVFHDDLEALKIPDEAIPGFFLPSLDLTPRDGVDGGEWDDDIPPNIAPVLSAFVRGKYAQRRRPWHPIPTSGMTL